ncbi:NAD(P)H-dependent oxidoreductase [Nitratireductor soli]|uniref:NAD(P)H-dependent oxidoreductase n=1 Tax=Nitratireductor soli TaxID=1670619 RepID=UPI00065E1E75|nr:NAD(P)H-dependent oxidoreductase [Nitratireductor soli]
MHALIVVAHPNPHSLTHAIAAGVAEGVSLSGPSGSSEIADLTREGFDPRFAAGDIDVHLKRAEVSAEIAAEQARIDRADALVLVYPVYWWSMPGLLKGWIDRVFANGWAYDEGSDGKLVKRLGRLPVHLLALGGAGMRTYARHGYFGAMKMQIDHGIFNYCGARVMTSELMLGSRQQDIEAHLDLARHIGRGVFAPTEKYMVEDAA